jgi:hypothetical protein
MNMGVQIRTVYCGLVLDERCEGSANGKCEESCPYKFPYTQSKGNRNHPDKLLICMEHRMGFEPMNTGFADQRVSHFAIGALARRTGSVTGALQKFNTTVVAWLCGDKASPFCNRGRSCPLLRSRLRP